MPYTMPAARNAGNVGLGVDRERPPMRESRLLRLELGLSGS
jgi:hypothetical protein